MGQRIRRSNSVPVVSALYACSSSEHACHFQETRERGGGAINGNEDALVHGDLLPNEISRLQPVSSCTGLLEDKRPVRTQHGLSLHVR